MKIQTKPLEKATGLIVVAQKEGKKASDEIHLLETILGFSLTYEIKKRSSDASDELGNVLTITTPGHKTIQAVTVIQEPTKSKSSKKKKRYESEFYRLAGATIQKEVACLKATSISICPSIQHSSFNGAIEAILEGIELSSYKFDKYKSGEKKKTTDPSIIILNSTAKEIKGFGNISKINEGVSLTRDLVSTPAADCTPQTLVQTAKAISRKPNISVKVFTSKQLETKKMNGILSVGKASIQKPAFITLSYAPKKKGVKDLPTIGLVGKGITFDAGGLSIKTGGGMETMKCDMAGAATVLGVFKAISLLQPAIRVKGYIPTAENMIDGNAMKPGDVLTMMSGKTVEVLNTDAEGRLILADALHYADSDGCDQLIDLATLTGSAVVALGNDYSGLFTDEDEIQSRLLKSANATGERMWPMPLANEYNSQLKSPIADIKNIGTRWGGAITAALFLQNFVEKTPWAHIDIAGPAFSDSASGYTPRGGTGYGVRTLVDYILGYANP